MSAEKRLSPINVAHRGWAVIVVVALAVVATSCSRSAESHLARGTAFLEDGQPREAALGLRNAVEKDPRNALFRFHLGQALAHTGDTATARREIRQALALDEGLEGADEARALLEALQER